MEKHRASSLIPDTVIQVSKNTTHENATTKKIIINVHTGPQLVHAARFKHKTNRKKIKLRTELEKSSSICAGNRCKILTQTGWLEI